MCHDIKRDENTTKTHARTLPSKNACARTRLITLSYAHTTTAHQAPTPASASSDAPPHPLADSQMSLENASKSLSASKGKESATYLRGEEEGLGRDAEEEAAGCDA